MAKIQQIWAREILDSRAFPTVEAILKLDTGHVVLSSVPSGTSTGKEEAVELRDEDPQRFLGKGVLKAVDNIQKKISPAVVGMDPQSQFEIDAKLISLDGTPNKKVLGANAILAVSQAVAKAGALSAGLQLYQWIYKLAVAKKAVAEDPKLHIPTPVFNMINGGAHGAGNLDFQEFQVIPATSMPFSKALQYSAEVYHGIKNSLIRRGAVHSVGDEGGMAPNLFTNAEAFEVNVEAIAETGHQIGQDFFLGLDAAADTIYHNGGYTIKDRSNSLNATTLTEYYEEVNEKYRITYLEDPLQEEDWGGWKNLTSKLGQKMMVVGDDLLVTNPEKVKKAISENACNAVLVKPNQIGTLSETFDVMKLAREAGWKTIVSHRSGETTDWFIADFAVGVKSDFVKFGAPARGERVVKYNRLWSIEQELLATLPQKAQEA